MTTSTMPQEGSAAPSFTLPCDSGETVSLEALRGKHVVLYFYPRDNTPGCTVEARDFSRLLPDFAKKNAVVFGVSTDSIAKHLKFRTSCELTVPLLADTEKAAHEAYGAWGEKMMYGKKVTGTTRSTFLISPDGTLARVWPKVKVEGHAAEVLAAIG